MSSQINTTNFESKVLNELAEIRKMLEGGMSGASSTKVKKERKPRDPDAPKNPWIVFTGRVRTALTNAQLPAGKQCQQFASYLKNEFPNAYEMTEEEIIEAHSSWEAPPAKPKETAAPVSDVEDKPKTKAVSRKKVVEAPAPAPAPQPITPPQPTTTGSKLRPLPFKSKKYLWDPESNGLWVAEKDGSKGKWAGVLSADRKSIDASAPNPDDTAA